MKQTTKSIAAVTASYEEWAAGKLDLVPEDLTRKHKLMGADIFSFFRATFYRFAQLFPELCPECAKAPPVLAVGDLHVENFGTWRDIEGRLVWGINDFDEVSRMPWTIDLVRLAASAHLAIDTEKLKIAHHEACLTILAGYKEGLEAGGRPWVLAGQHGWLREMVQPGLRDPAVFWGKLSALPLFEGRVPKAGRRGIERMMPGRNLDYPLRHRVAGLGSLGRQRFVAIAEFEGGLVCREAKALAPSAWDWAGGRPAGAIRYQETLDTAIRAADPFVRARSNWIVRRLAPDCGRVELAMFPRQRDETKLMHAMGWEIANVHLGSRHPERLIADIKRRRGNWLHRGASAMVAATKADWAAWRTAKSQ
jgi:hypothetical protein